jgi:hypothetical protein
VVAGVVGGENLYVMTLGDEPFANRMGDARETGMTPRIPQPQNAH